MSTVIEQVKEAVRSVSLSEKNGKLFFTSITLATPIMEVDGSLRHFALLQVNTRRHTIIFVDGKDKDGKDKDGKDKDVNVEQFLLTTKSQVDEIVDFVLQVHILPMDNVELVLQAANTFGESNIELKLLAYKKATKLGSSKAACKVAELLFNFDSDAKDSNTEEMLYFAGLCISTPSHTRSIDFRFRALEMAGYAMLRSTNPKFKNPCLGFSYLKEAESIAKLSQGRNSKSGSNGGSSSSERNRLKLITLQCLSECYSSGVGLPPGEGKNLRTALEYCKRAMRSGSKHALVEAGKICLKLGGPETEIGLGYLESAMTSSSSSCNSATDAYLRFHLQSLAKGNTMERDINRTIEEFNMMLQKFRAHNQVTRKLHVLLYKLYRTKKDNVYAIGEAKIVNDFYPVEATKLMDDKPSSSSKHSLISSYIHRLVIESLSFLCDFYRTGYTFLVSHTGENLITGDSRCKLDGLYNLTKNVAEAARMNRILAEVTGFATSAHNYAFALWDGIGCSENKEEALVWFRRAEDAARSRSDEDVKDYQYICEDAKRWLTSCHAHTTAISDGAAVNSAVVVGKKWMSPLFFMNDAIDGNARAQFLLAECLWHGMRCEKDKTLALDWYARAAAAGHRASIRWLSYVHADAREDIHSKEIAKMMYKITAGPERDRDIDDDLDTDYCHTGGVAHSWRKLKEIDNS